MSIGHRMAATGQNSPDFSLFPVKDDPDAVKKISGTISQALGIPSEKIQLDGIRNVDVLEPFVKRLQKIKADTGMYFPAIRALEIIEDDPTCIASYKPYEDVLYISSRYFNSKEALLTTLKDWAANGYLPKQAKSIAYLAEHEAAHIRIPDDWLKSDEALDILRKFNKTKYANDNDRFSIEEFFADSVAWHRVAPASVPAPMAEAVEFLQKRSV